LQFLPAGYICITALPSAGATCEWVIFPRLFWAHWAGTGALAFGCGLFLTNLGIFYPVSPVLSEKFSKKAGNL